MDISFIFTTIGFLGDNIILRECIVVYMYRGFTTFMKSIIVQTTNILKKVIYFNIISSTIFVDSYNSFESSCL